MVRGREGTARRRGARSRAAGRLLGSYKKASLGSWQPAGCHGNEELARLPGREESALLAARGVTYVMLRVYGPGAGRRPRRGVAARGWRPWLSRGARAAGWGTLTRVGGGLRGPGGAPSGGRPPAACGEEGWAGRWPRGASGSWRPRLRPWTPLTHLLARFTFLRLPFSGRVPCSGVGADVSAGWSCARAGEVSGRVGGRQMRVAGPGRVGRDRAAASGYAPGTVGRAGGRPALRCGPRAAALGGQCSRAQVGVAVPGKAWRAGASGTAMPDPSAGWPARWARRLFRGAPAWASWREKDRAGDPGSCVFPGVGRRGWPGARGWGLLGGRGRGDQVQAALRARRLLPLWWLLAGGPGLV